MNDNQNSNPEAALPSLTIVRWTFGLVVVFSIVSAVVFVVTDPNLHLDLKGFTVLAPIYAAAQAIERLLEPIAARIKPNDEQKTAVKTATEQKLTADAPQEQQSAQSAEQSASDALKKRQSERALIFFAMASCTSLVLTGVLGLGLLQAMATEDLKEYIGAIDVALTGLVIGAGTKPLHDLISKLEKSKESSDPATKPTVAG